MPFIIFLPLFLLFLMFFFFLPYFHSFPVINLLSLVHHVCYLIHSHRLHSQATQHLCSISTSRTCTTIPIAPAQQSAGHDHLSGACAPLRRLPPTHVGTSFLRFTSLRGSMELQRVLLYLNQFLNDICFFIKDCSLSWWRAAPRRPRLGSPLVNCPLQQPACWPGVCRAGCGHPSDCVGCAGITAWVRATVDQPTRRCSNGGSSAAWCGLGGCTRTGCCVVELCSSGCPRGGATVAQGVARCTRG
jgi:hypothetical protein